jgi:hypothetical protein
VGEEIPLEEQLVMEVMEHMVVVEELVDLILAIQVVMVAMEEMV